MSGSEEREFAFRPWVRGTCRRAMIWGVGAVALLGAVAWQLRTPDSAPLSRAFGVLAAYGLLFLATLLKIWWTARGPAVRLDAEGLSYQPLHLFRPRRIDFSEIAESGPRPGTQALRLVLGPPGEEREFFINLGVIQGRNEFLDLLGESLAAHGLAPVPDRKQSWKRPSPD